MSSADAPSAAVRTMTPPFFSSRLLRMSRRRMRSSSSSRRETPRPSPFGTKTTKRPGSEISVVSRAPFDFIGSLTAWTRISWPRLSRSWILRPRTALELGRDDLVDVEEAVLLEADLDERGLHAREDVVDGALVDVARDRAALGPLEVDLGDLVVLEDGDALLADVDRDEQLALRGRQRRARWRRTPARWRCAACAASRSPLGPRPCPAWRPASRLGGLGFGLGLGLGLRRGAGPGACDRGRRGCRGGASSVRHRLVRPPLAGGAVLTVSGRCRCRLRARGCEPRSSVGGFRRRNHEAKESPCWARALRVAPARGRSARCMCGQTRRHSRLPGSSGPWSPPCLSGIGERAELRALRA